MNEQLNENQNIYQIKMHRWRMAFFGLVILLAGIIIGSSAVSLGRWRFLRRHNPGPEQAMFRMARGLQDNLNLSPQQRRMVEPIIRMHMEKLEEIRRNARPLIEQEMRRMKDDIFPILNEEQKARWMQMMRHLPMEPPMRSQPMPPPNFEEQPPPPRHDNPEPQNRP